MDLYLKANNEASLWTALVNAGAAQAIEVKDETGIVIKTEYMPTNGVTVDIIGTILRPTGNMVSTSMPSGETAMLPEMETLDGFHANVRGSVDLGDKVEYVYYTPTNEELSDPNFVMPEPQIIRTPGPLSEFLVYPETPSRVWF